MTWWEEQQERDMKKKKIVLREAGKLKAIGFEKDKFILIHQGIPLKSGEIQNVNGTAQCYEAYAEFDELPACPWGAGVYRIREDFTLALVKANYDTSD